MSDTWSCRGTRLSHRQRQRQVREKERESKLLMSVTYNVTCRRLGDALTTRGSSTQQAPASQVNTVSSVDLQFVMFCTGYRPLCLRPFRQGGSRMFSIRPFFRPTARSYVTKHVNVIFWKKTEWTDFAANWHNCSTGQRDETRKFGGQEAEVRFRGLAEASFLISWVE